jgi:uncharacterized membrane protein YcaP (DUF421 family)
MPRSITGEIRRVGRMPYCREMLPDLALQAVYALAYYAGLVVVTRLAGKRLAGQTTTFDLVVLIQLAVVLQTTALRPGTARAAVFVVTVLAAHISLARLCARHPGLRHVVRGEPRRLVSQGNVIDRALAEEGISRDELEAGLRKLGFESPAAVEQAVLEETGHISAVPRKDS